MGPCHTFPNFLENEFLKISCEKETVAVVNRGEKKKINLVAC